MSERDDEFSRLFNDPNAQAILDAVGAVQDRYAVGDPARTVMRFGEPELRCHITRAAHHGDADAAFVLRTVPRLRLITLTSEEAHAAKDEPPVRLKWARAMRR